MGFSALQAQDWFKRRQGEIEKIVGSAVKISAYDHPQPAAANEVYIRIDSVEQGLDIARFRLASGWPYLPDVAFSYDAHVHRSLRGRGLGTLLNKLRVEFARECGFGLLLCTDRQDNGPQRSILIKNGWQHFAKFNKVYLSGIVLSKE